MAGLRDRKKRQTHDALSQAAIELFLERGFDEVSVADIAAAADVSKPTLFKYFATKQDLAVHRFADHAGEAARVASAARAAAAGPASLAGPVDVAGAVAALREHFVDGLRRRDPVTGLNDTPGVLAYHRLVFTTPALATRVHQFIAADQAALADVLGNGLAGELAAADLISTQQVLSRRNWAALSAGITADTQYRTAVAEAKQAYGRLIRP
ncbi:TetR family transcriptional regulator [Streptomyces sp. SID13031]|uniref:TetR family transcriptional regulator n=1 Tax=Streptomyces sp. SID13031 TaxID=2706046 RepID=UPI0013CB2A3C|nr:TetR family transcriptional regulator [Streptomyces sp. SID13031]NEA30374.1 TetR family transcriptional regulator [Streptomyces sp. SID13031]